MIDNCVAIFTKPKTVEFIKQELPYPQDKYICVKFEYCAICGGDYSSFIGRRTDYPYSLGHEFIGRVFSVSKDVTEFDVGDYVVSDLNYRCGECVYCRNSQSHLCEKNSIASFSNRAFALYGNIHANYLYKIPNFSWLPRACLIEPLSCVIHACNSIKCKSEMNVLICGGGGIGSLFCFYLSRIIKEVNIVVCEPNKNKLNLLKQSFAISEYDENSPQKFDWIIDCSNSISGLEFCLNVCSKGGNLCVMSHLYGLNTSFVYNTICEKEINCKFPLRNGNSENMRLAVTYIDNYWKIKDDNLIGIYNDLTEAFNKKDSSPFCKQVVDVSRFLIL